MGSNLQLWHPNLWSKDWRESVKRLLSELSPMRIELPTPHPCWMRWIMTALNTDRTVDTNLNLNAAFKCASHVSGRNLQFCSILLYPIAVYGTDCPIITVLPFAYSLFPLREAELPSTSIYPVRGPLTRPEPPGSHLPVCYVPILQLIFSFSPHIPLGRACMHESVHGCTYVCM